MSAHSREKTGTAAARVDCRNVRAAWKVSGNKCSMTSVVAQQWSSVRCGWRSMWAIWSDLSGASSSARSPRSPQCAPTEGGTFLAGCLANDERPAGRRRQGPGSEKHSAPYEGPIRRRRHRACSPEHFEPPPLRSAEQDRPRPASRTAVGHAGGPRSGTNPGGVGRRRRAADRRRRHG